MLGALIQADGQPGPALLRRMGVAIALYRAGAAPRLLLSGGGPRSVPEAEVMRRIALSAGVPESALLLEARSSSTVENALESARLFANCPRRTVLLVTDRAHALRASLLFRMAGLPVRRVVTAAAPANLLLMRATEIVKLPISIWRMVRGRHWPKNARGMPPI